jgi:hypothetical protein
MYVFFVDYDPPTNEKPFRFSGAMVTYTAAANGSITANINAVGTVDWGRAYATVPFSVEGNRSVLVGWAYVSDHAAAPGTSEF